jgi:hypothetical protein
VHSFSGVVRGEEKGKKEGMEMGVYNPPSLHPAYYAVSLRTM